VTPLTPWDWIGAVIGFTVLVFALLWAVYFILSSISGRGSYGEPHGAARVRHEMRRREKLERRHRRG
jgi:hypothetical protein